VGFQTLKGAVQVWVGSVDEAKHTVFRGFLRAPA
jgi:hypothetical protein